MRPATAEQLAAVARAQQLATAHQTAYGVWLHVGCYGHRSGDIPATYGLKVQSLTRPDPDGRVWALLACADPEGV